ncbi:MAG: ATP-grasp domain-containing protein [Deltaproteobacteria bacterium]|nr:ATP-grasp domain-containing protein [Deltaproteobacteria bacterium]
MKENVLVLGNFRQTVTVVRSLGRSGYRIIVGRDKLKSFTELSRHVSDVWCYNGDNRLQFFKDLEAKLKTLGPRTTIVFPVGEFSLERMAAEAERFKGLATFVMPDPAIVARCLDKRATHELAAKLDVPVPPTVESFDREKWQASARTFGLPLVIKRASSFTPVFGEKAFIAKNEQAVKWFFDNVASDPEPNALLLQKFVKGFRHNCHFAAVDGKVAVYFEQRVLRTDSLNDSGYGVEGISVTPSPKLREYTERFVAALGYTGVGCTQFLVDDKAGSAYFLELNPRLDATCALPYQCGIDFPRLAVDCAKIRAGLTPTRVLASPKSYVIGRRAAWIVGDVFGLLNAVNHRKISALQAIGWVGKIILSALRNRHHITWDLRDPLPTLYLAGERLGSGLGNRFSFLRRPVSIVDKASE